MGQIKYRSDVVRQIVDEWISTQDHEVQRQRELQALDELTELRLKIQEKHGIYYGDLIEEARA